MAGLMQPGAAGQGAKHPRQNKPGLFPRQNKQIRAVPQLGVWVPGVPEPLTPRQVWVPNPSRMSCSILVSAGFGVGSSSKYRLVSVGHVQKVFCDFSTKSSGNGWKVKASVDIFGAASMIAAFYQYKHRCYKHGSIIPTVIIFLFLSLFFGLNSVYPNYSSGIILLEEIELNMAKFTSLIS